MNLKKRNYRSCFKEHLDMFSEYMRASRHWSSGYDSNIRSFDRYCAEQFPDDEGITQEMIDSWCRKRTTETNLSCHTRQCCIAAFVKYLRARGLADVHEPTRPKKNRSSYVPHAFTHEELKNFFNACDSIRLGPGHKRKCDKLKKLTAPAIFRALYSTGMPRQGSLRGTMSIWISASSASGRRKANSSGMWSSIQHLSLS